MLCAPPSWSCPAAPAPATPQELRRSCTKREVRGWATRLLFILTRCSRLVATEECSPFGAGGSGSPRGAYMMTVQPRSRGAGRLRRFSGFPMLRNQLSLDTRAAGQAAAAATPHVVSPRGGVSPLLRSATAPSRSFKDLMAGMHHLRIHEGQGGGKGAGQGGTKLSPMPESPSTVRSPAPSETSTPSHPAARQVGLSPLGRSVVTALEAELEQAAAGGAASAERPQQAQQAQQQQQQQQAQAQQQQQREQHDALQGPAAEQQTPADKAGSSGTGSPIGTDSPSKRQNIFKLLKLRFQHLRSPSKEPPGSGDTAVDAADNERSRQATRDGLQDGMHLLATPQVRATAGMPSALVGCPPAAAWALCCCFFQCLACSE